MASKPIYKVNVNQLRPGVFIKLDIPWYKHPFLVNKFKITKQDQIEVLKELNIQSVLCIPDKSEALPLTAEEMGQQTVSLDADAKQVLQELWNRKNERLDTFRKQKREYLQCEKKFMNTAIAIQNIMKNMRPEEAVLPSDAESMIEEMMQSLMSSGETVVRLMNVQADRDDLYQHTVNVTVLSLMLGQELGLNAHVLRELGIGAVFHDIGMQRIPKRVRCKRSPLSKNEIMVLQLHPQFGEEIILNIGDFPKEARKVVRSHHEKIDGSGYPDKLQDEKISTLARIVAITDSFDMYCNGINMKKPLTPFQALSFMYKNEGDKYDRKFLSVFIRSLGIYPPGTIVALNSGAVGIVVAASKHNPLRPSLVLYDPEVPRNDALIFSMEDDPDLKILRSALPSELSEKVRNYLMPKNSVRYFIDQSDSGIVQPS